MRRQKLAAIVSALGEYKRRGRFLNFSCPFHQGSRLNFGVDMASGFFVCLGCGERGDLQQLYDRVIGEGGTGTDTEVDLGVLADIDADASDVEESASSPVPDASECHAWFTRRYTGLASGVGVLERKACEYLHSRKVDVRRFEVGLLHDDAHIGRVIFPFRSNGFVTYYVARLFIGSGLKVKNPAREDGWPGRDEVLFRSDDLKEHAVICEGVFDAIAAETLTKTSATCLLGKTASKGQIRLLRRRGVRVVTIMLDRDARADAITLALRLGDEGMKVRLCTWSREVGKDPSDCSEYEVRRLFETARDINPLEALALLAESA